MTGSELAAEFVQLESEKDVLMETVRQIIEDLYGPDAKAKLTIEGKGSGGIEHRLRAQWAKENLTQVKISGRTVYLRSEVVGFATGGDKPRMHAALREAGYGDLVVSKEEVNYNTMRGFLGEFPKDDDGLPVLPTPELEAAIELTKRVSVQTRKA